MLSELPLFLPGQETGETFTQPTSYRSFQCIGAACEDTCCEGWGVFVDKTTFQKYQTCLDSELGAKLKELVTIKPAGNDLMYATILSACRAVFVSRRWSLQYSEAARRRLSGAHVRYLSARRKHPR